MHDGQEVHTSLMARDWWWPWWISSLIDVGIVVVAVIVFMRASRRRVRQIATVVGIGAIVAAGLAPVVMQGKDSSSPMRMQTENTMMTTTTP
jgi:glucan phosphoethanolaminetransferase (alkaline phosphatase superfamily)